MSVRACESLLIPFVFQYGRIQSRENLDATECRVNNLYDAQNHCSLHVLVSFSISDHISMSIRM